MSEFGERLKQARINKGLNQEELSKLINITQASISQFEKGLRYPTPSNIKKFAEVLEVPVDFFAGENQGKFEYEMLMRNLKNLSPDALKSINDYIDYIKFKDKK